ncbi:hypothetical protein ACA910_011753 [Epithemia clementina (nom. ined.)]
MSGMVSDIAALTLQEFLARPYIQEVLWVEPKTPQSVLSFFYGVDFSDTEDIQEKLVHGGALLTMPSLWFYGGEEYDSLCVKSFAGAVRKAGRGEWKTTSSHTADAWTKTVDGLAAQLILCDQISRNAFRGTIEAFAYDEAALNYAGQLSTHFLNQQHSENEENMNQEIQGTLYQPYLSSIVMALMHSEKPRDHKNALQILLLAKEQSPPSLLRWWEQQENFELEHKQVIDRFGRYPHRNKLKGRESTEEELQWLADFDNLPGWAKSQGNTDVSR